MAANRQLHAAAASFSSRFAALDAASSDRGEAGLISSSNDWNLSRFTMFSSLLRLLLTKSCVDAKLFASRGSGAKASAPIVKESVADDADRAVVPLP